MARTGVQGGMLIQSHHEPAPASLCRMGQPLQALQAEEGQVRQVQPIVGQGLLIERAWALRLPGLGEQRSLQVPREHIPAYPELESGSLGSCAEETRL